MTSATGTDRCDQSDLVLDYALHALTAAETSAAEAHISVCQNCRQELEMLRELGASPTDVLRPPTDLGARLARRVAEEAGVPPLLPPAVRWSEPEWEEVGPGIFCKVLATDADNRRVSMLVRLAPGAEYPPHRHAGIEELFLLHGELWIDDRKLYPGDYNRAEPGTADARVYSETGCACVLITSLEDDFSMKP
jgi:anti-sigma factor ChrR (cupin superfamily)